MTQLVIGLVLVTQLAIGLVLGSMLVVMAMALGDLGWTNERYREVHVVGGDYRLPVRCTADAERGGGRMTEYDGVERSTATETLRAMLDERWVEYDYTDRLSEVPSYQSVIWWFNTADRAEFREYHDGSTQLLIRSSKTNLTPEQAIAATLGHSSNCTNGERTNAACKPVTYDNGYSVDHLEPGEYHEFWEPACACGNCGELIPMRKFCPNCGCRLEVEA